MWIDENGVAHTVWVPPEAVLGEEAVAALRAVPRDVADTALAELNVVATSVEDEAAAEAPTGPSDLGESDLDDLAYPPVFPGLAPQDGEALSATVLRFLSEVPAEWRVEALEAVYDVLEPPDDGEDDDEEDDERDDEVAAE
jgi:hypothetical protein